MNGKQLLEILQGLSDKELEYPVAIGEYDNHLFSTIEVINVTLEENSIFTANSVTKKMMQIYLD